MASSGTLMEAFCTRVMPVTESGCWLWVGWVRPDGYGELHYRGLRDYAHRIAYRLFKSDIPPSMQVDHLCRVRCCVNPDHLQAVTQRENILRGYSAPSLNAKRTHCIRGHELLGENLTKIATRPRGRICVACRRRRDRDFKERHKDDK